jgi:hypothetical protein
MFEIDDGLFIDPWQVAAVKKLGDNTCVVFLKGMSTKDGFTIEKDALEAATDVLEARQDENEHEDDEDVENEEE